MCQHLMTWLGVKPELMIYDQNEDIGFDDIITESDVTVYAHLQTELHYHAVDKH